MEHVLELILNPQYAQYYLLAGLILIIMVLMRQMGQRARQNARKQKQREETLRVAQEADRKNRTQTVLPMPKSKIIPPQTRAPLGDPFGSPFVGNIQGHAAKWEAEIHQLGRQIIGQIDSKMAALQAITLDANRTANRLEILVEHLEQIARNQIEQQQTAQKAVADVLETPATVIPATESVSEATPLADVLREIDGDLKGIRKAIRQSTTLREQVAPATVLRLAELQVAPDYSSAHIRGEVEMLTNYGLEPQEIAERLNISLGEVDLILQVQRNQV